MNSMLSLMVLFIIIFSPTVQAQEELNVTQPAAVEHALSGSSTAINDDYAFIASPQQDYGNLLNVGAVTVYHNFNGEWKVEEILQPEGLPAMSNFGISLALEAKTALIGSIGDHSNGLFSGTVYLYENNDGLWTHTGNLKGSDTSIGHRFGYSVELYNNVAIVGAYMAPGIEEKTGAVYVFERTGEEWNQTAKLVTEDGKTGDSFGYSVEIINEITIAVGAYRSDEMDSGQGTVYIFKKTGNGWQQKDKLDVSGGGQDDMFGYSLSSCYFEVSGEGENRPMQVLFIGSPGSFGGNGKTGAVYTYVNSGDVWEYHSNIAPETLSHNSQFGISIACNSFGELYIGANRAHSDPVKETGSVYIYEIGIENEHFLIGTGTELVASTLESYELFGSIISTNNQYILISSPFTDRDGFTNSGTTRFFSSGKDSSDDDSGIITTYELFQNYPNPFNPKTVIQYQLPETNDVRLEVFDMLGRRVATLVNELVPAGVHEISFDASNLASGIYIYRLTAADQVLNKKLTLIK